MPRKKPSPREELISIQQRIVRRQRQEIYQSVGGLSSDLRRYQKRYERDVQDYRRAVPRDKLVEQLSSADIVVQGDFHTLRESQRAAARLVSDLADRRPVVLAVEMVPREMQIAIDAWVAGEIRTETFLEVIDWENTWGFDWEQYRPLFEVARERELQVYGLNTCRELDGDRLRARDEIAAEVLTRATLAHPEAVVYAVVGDFHVCRPHLPASVERALRSEGEKRRIALVHQNVDDLYWKLAGRRMEHRAEVLEIATDEFCLMTATPIAKYQSYFHWEMGDDGLLEGGGRVGSGDTHVAGEVARLIQTIARFLRLDPDDFQDFIVYTTDDLDFLEDLAKSGRFSQRQLREIKHQILNEESYYITVANIIYLSDFALDHAAEEASHYINNKLSPHPDCALPGRTDFYYRILKEALGFFGSKVINHLRFAYGEEEYRAFCQESAAQPTHPEYETLSTISRFVLRHMETERETLSTGQRPRLRAIYHQETDVHLGITHALGYRLGDRLYTGLLDGTFRRRDIRRLFQWKLEELDGAEEVYFDLLARIEEKAGRKTG